MPQRCYLIILFQGLQALFSYFFCVYIKRTPKASSHIFFFILQALGTPNLAVSTISIATSFLASYLMLFRNSYYALAYAANDIVLIVLWILASLTQISYVPMVICFSIFLLNDIYGFFSWKLREKRQKQS